MAAAAPAIIMAVAAAGSAYYQMDAQEKQADAQIDAAEKNNAAQQNQNDIKVQEIQNLNTQNKTEQNKKNLREQAKIRVSQSEGGLTGLSLDRLFDVSDMNNDNNLEMMDRNTDSRLAQNTSEILALSTQNQGRINSANSSKTSDGMAALQIGTSALGGYTSGGGFN
jgi:hypothetical protein